MINFLLLALLFVISFLLAQKYLINIKAERYRKKNAERLKTNENLFKHFFSKFNFIKTKDDFLSKQGYPLNLNVISYYAMKIMLATVFFVASLVNYRSIIVEALFFCIGYFLIDVYIILRRKERDGEICDDLLRVINSINLQVSSGVSLKQAFKKQYENCKNRDLKKAMIEFSTRYELSELNIIEASKKLSDSFDILELKMFCNVLETYNEKTQIEEELENLTEMLNVRKIEKIKRNTLSRIVYITFGVITALANIILITFYPLFIDIGQGFSSVFK